jgi:hypothetical protein
LGVREIERERRIFEEASAICPRVAISSGAMIAIKNALFPIPLRIDLPIGASGKAHPPPPGETAPLQRYSARFLHLIEDAKRPGQLTNTAAAFCSS